MKLMNKSKISALLAIVVLSFFVVSCGGSQESADDASADTEEPAEEASADEPAAPNTLTAKEKEDGWMLLFDGETSDGWRGYGKETFHQTGRSPKTESFIWLVPGEVKPDLKTEGTSFMTRSSPIST